MPDFLGEATRLANTASDSSARLFAELDAAIYCSRKGDESDASKWIARMRRCESQATEAECVSAANLAEGVLAFCQSRYTQAADKLRRAESLCLIRRNDRLLRMVLAWSAHVEFNDGRLNVVPELLKRAITAVPSTEHLTLARVASTLAMALHHADRYDLARPWYERARREAVAAGDDQGIDAVLHNTVAFRVNNLRLASLAGEPIEQDLLRAEQEYASSVTYDAMKAPESFRWSLPLVAQQLAILRNRFDEARTGLEDWISHFADQAPDRLRGVAQADLALACASVGSIDDALAHMSIVDRTPSDNQTLDETATIQFRRHQLAGLMGREDEAQAYLAAALEALQGHRHEQAAVVAALGDFNIDT